MITYNATDNISGLNDLIIKAQNAEQIINGVLHDDSTGNLIANAIVKLLPESGRTWAGKPTAAKKTMPFQADKTQNLSVIVKSKKIYHYLYYPDDGSNTRNHAGNQHIMSRGLDAVQDNITNNIMQKLIESIGG